MVQVDIFWSYGLASGLALAANRKLKSIEKPFESKYFLMTVLWLAIFFAPSGIYLLWEFPSWETMFVAADHRSIPTWLVALFSVSNITQGILGFYVTYIFIRKSKMQWAKFQTIWSHLAMFFVLIVGWDGTGFQRFTHTGTAAEFAAGIRYPWFDFLSSPVAITLIVMGVILVPSYFYLCQSWIKESSNCG